MVSELATRVLGIVAAIVLLFLAGQAVVGATRVGISNDEPGHRSRLDQWFETGWYLPARFFDDRGAIRADIEVGRLHSYGAGYSIVGHAVAVLSGAEEWGTTQDTAAAYTARGVAVALLGIAAALAVGYSLLVVSGRWMVGMWSAAATFAMPLWTGYSMFAVKDIPAAAGWTLVTAALVVGLHPRSGWRRPTMIGVMCFAGVWFSVGVRTALWVALAASVMTFGVLAASHHERRRLRAGVVAVVSGLAAGFAAVGALHYRNAATPGRWLLSAVRTAGDFDVRGATLTAGQLVTEKPPWWYLPAWAGASIPMLVGLLAVAGMVLAVVAVTRSPAGARPFRGRLGQRSAGMTLWMQQALLLPTIATIGGATMYGGLRQHLYILPALAALSGFAAYRLMAVAKQARLTVVTALLMTALVLPVWGQARLFPYNFVFKNAATGSVNDRWETDMHWVSAREAMTRIPSSVDAWCYERSIRLLSGELRQPAFSGCRLDAQVGPFVSEQGSTLTSADAAPDGLWVIGRKYRGSPPARSCIEWDNVTRRLRGEDVVLVYVLICDR